MPHPGRGIGGLRQQFQQQAQQAQQRWGQPLPGPMQQPQQMMGQQAAMMPSDYDPSSPAAKMGLSPKGYKLYQQGQFPQPIPGRQLQQQQAGVQQAFGQQQQQFSPSPQMRQQMLARQQMMQQQAQQQITPQMESEYATLQATIQREGEAQRANPMIGMSVRSPQEEKLLQTFSTARPPPPQPGMLPSPGWASGPQQMQQAAMQAPPGMALQRTDMIGSAPTQVPPQMTDMARPYGPPPQQPTVQDQVALLPAGFARPTSPSPSAGGGGGGGGDAGAGGPPTSWKMSIEPMSSGGIIGLAGGGYMMPYGLAGGGYVPMIYANGGYIPAYGFGDWIKKKAGQVGKLALKAAPIVAGLTMGPLGAGVVGGLSKTLSSKLQGGDWGSALQKGIMTGMGTYAGAKGLRGAKKGWGEAGGSWQDKLEGALGGLKDQYSMEDLLRMAPMVAANEAMGAGHAGGAGGPASGRISTVGAGGGGGRPAGGGMMTDVSAPTSQVYNLFSHLPQTRAQGGYVDNLYASRRFGGGPIPEYGVGSYIKKLRGRKGGKKGGKRSRGRRGRGGIGSSIAAIRGRQGGTRGGRGMIGQGLQRRRDAGGIQGIDIGRLQGIGGTGLGQGMIGGIAATGGTGLGQAPAPPPAAAIPEFVPKPLPPPPVAPPSPVPAPPPQMAPPPPAAPVQPASALPPPLIHPPSSPPPMVAPPVAPPPPPAPDPYAGTGGPGLSFQPPVVPDLPKRIQKKIDEGKKLTKKDQKKIRESVPPPSPVPPQTVEPPSFDDFRHLVGPTIDEFGPPTLPPPSVPPPSPFRPPEIGEEPPVEDFFGPPPPQPIAPVAAQPPVPPRTVEPPDFGGPEELFGYPADRGPADVPPDVAAVAPLTAAAMPTPTPTATPTPTTPPRPSDLPPGVPWIPGGWKPGMPDPFDYQAMGPDPTQVGAGGEQQVGLDMFGNPIAPAGIEIEGPVVGRRPEQRVGVDTDAEEAAQEERETERIETADPEAAKEAARQADAARKAAREAQEAHAAKVAEAAAAAAEAEATTQVPGYGRVMPTQGGQDTGTGSGQGLGNLFEGSGYNPFSMPTTAAQFTQAGDQGTADMLNRINAPAADVESYVPAVPTESYVPPPPPVAPVELPAKQAGGPIGSASILEELLQDETGSQVIDAVMEALQNPNDPESEQTITGFQEAFPGALEELVGMMGQSEQTVPMQAGGLIPGDGDAMADDRLGIVNPGEPDSYPILTSDGEFVVAGDVVAGLGSGNSKRGASVLNQLQEDVRTNRTGSPEQAPPIDLSEVLPGTYGEEYA